MSLTACDLLQIWHGHTCQYSCISSRQLTASWRLLPNIFPRWAIHIYLISVTYWYAC